MAVIRRMEVADVRRVVEMGHSLRNESRYAEYDFNFDRATDFVARHVSSDTYAGFLLEVEGEIVGVLLAYSTYIYFGHDVVAQESAFFIEPEYRGKKYLELLVNAYLKWAHKQGAKCAYLGVTTGVNEDRTVASLEKHGFHRFGSLLRRKI
ncbi:hypothetical protein GCM10023116_01810 [Kistimonas scapharcae]|uniref:N-acetyltransferase domain-containing protein n=1 Tax=Kistimonas scapharcae TaxID=1036133 RepID=A0ABP8UVY3_9GAMM